MLKFAMPVETLVYRVVLVRQIRKTHYSFASV